MAKMDKERNKELVEIAQKVLKEQNILLSKDCTILDSYNGQVASLSVSVAMLGLVPTLAVFYQDKPNDNEKKAYRRNVLDAVSRMICYDSRAKDDWKHFSDNGYFAKNMFSYAIDHRDDSLLRNEIIECAIALKQIVRTYNLV